MNEYDVVRVIKLEQADRSFDGTPEIKRSPRVGDIGTIVRVLTPDRAFVVECVDRYGMTIWLADFGIDEIEPHYIQF